MSLLDALTKLVDDELAQEGITPELLAMIDLTVAYSPVIPFRGGRLEENRASGMSGIRHHRHVR